MTSRLHRAIRGGVPSNRAKNDTRVGPRRSHAKRRAVTLIGLSVGGVLLLAGCTTAVALDTSPTYCGLVRSRSRHCRARR